MAKLNQAMTDLLRYNSAILPRKRSSFNKSHSHTTTFDSGYLIPLMWDRVLPGDEKKIKFSGLARMATPIHPVMDQANFDVFAFYCPDRLWWRHAKEFYGENKDAEFNSDGEYVMPYLTPAQYRVFDGETENDNGIGSLNDYFGFPVIDDDFLNVEANALNTNLFATAGLHRCYQLIWNEWFRNSSIQPSLQLNDGDIVTDNELRVIRKLRKVNKYPDYFTTLLREPQAGEAVNYLPLSEWNPVVTRLEKNGSIAALLYDGGPNGVAEPPLIFRQSGDWYDRNGVDEGSLAVGYGGDLFNTPSSVAAPEEVSLVPNNLWANLTNLNMATINNLRSAITVQQLLEIDALGGKRYQTLIASHWGVFVPDATLQRPELLGVSRTPVGMRQVIQTSETSGDSPLGNTAAYSLTSVTNEWICNKSFTEPGFIMVLGCVRPVVSYSQGLDPLLTKLQRYDHYYPVFDNLGNQPVYNRNIYLGQDASDPNAVFGYQEAWTEYRIKNNRVSGYMRPDVTGTLSSWNYAISLDATPVLDSNFIEVDPNLIDRTIATPDEPQFICDCYFDYIDIKNMGVHSIPGLTRL